MGGLMNKTFGFLNSLTGKKQLWMVVILGFFVLSMLCFHIPLTLGLIGLVVLCFSCELMDSSLGMGYGTTLTPVLLAFGYEPLDLVPTILLSEFLSGFSAAYFHHEIGNVDLSKGSVDSRVALMLALGSVVGVSIGVSVALQIPTQTLKLAIGVIILIAGLAIWVFLNHQFVFKTWKMFLLASVASFNKALSGGGYGPLLTSGQILSGIKGKASVGITSFAEGFTCLVGVILFMGRGQSFQLELMIPVITGALLAVPFSAEFVKKVNEKSLKLAIAILTILLGLFTIIKTLT